MPNNDEQQRKREDRKQSFLAMAALTQRIR